MQPSALALKVLDDVLLLQRCLLKRSGRWLRLERRTESHSHNCHLSSISDLLLITRLCY